MEFYEEYLDEENDAALQFKDTNYPVYKTQSTIEIEETIPNDHRHVKRSGQTNSFSALEKKKLASLVQQKVAIWKLDEKSHQNSHAVAAAWSHISKEMDKPVDKCKLAWRSLRNGMRYRNRAKKIYKSGSEAQMEHEDAEAVLLDEDAVDWEFADCMAFLSPTTKTRRTFSTTISNESSDLPSSFDNDVSGDGCSSNYSYMTPCKQKDSLAGSAVTIAESIQELPDNKVEKLNFIFTIKN